MRLSVKIILTLTAIAVGIGYYVREENKKEERIRLLNSATELPSGVHDVWFETLKKSMDEKITIVGGRVAMRDFSGIKMVPINQISAACDGFSISLEEGGETGSTLALLGVTSSPSSGLKMPNIGVGRRSPAAKKLYDETCFMISRWLESAASK